MRTCMLIAGALLWLPASTLLADKDYTGLQETAFTNGGRLTIELSAGNHRIKPSADDHIRVHWRVNDGDKGDVEARTDIDGTSARLEIDGPRKDFRTVIEVPRHTDLTVRLTAGELDIGNIEGDKDIRLRAGDLSIDVGNTRDYAHVEGSLWAGDIDGGPLDAEASGLFRSIEWDGDGEHELRFKLYAGDVTLYRGAEDD